MTTKKLVLAQTSEELKFILNKCKNNKNLFCVLRSETNFIV